MIDFESRWNNNSKSVYINTTKELLELLNQFDANIDIEGSDVDLSLKVRLTSGETLDLGVNQSYTKLLKEFDKRCNLGINFDYTTRQGLTYNICFLTKPKFKVAVEENVNGKKDESQTSTETFQPRAVEASRRGEKGEEERWQEKEQLPEGLKEPRWKSLSTPTYGKKNLYEKAKEYGIDLGNYQSIKYRILVEKFKAAYEEKYN